jgi:hypothetical protein
MNHQPQTGEVQHVSHNTLTFLSMSQPFYRSQYCKYDGGKLAFNITRNPDSNKFHCVRCPLTFSKGAELAVSLFHLSYPRRDSLIYRLTVKSAQSLF